MKLIELTRGCFTIVDNKNFEELNEYKWLALGGKKIYAARRVDGIIQYMHRIILGIEDEGFNIQVDHIDGNSLDNRKKNLRVCTVSENQQNKEKQKGIYHSKYKGVSKDSKSKKWVAYITLKKKQIRLGRFLSEKDAAKAYDKAAKKIYGKHANLNFKEKT